MDGLLKWMIRFGDLIYGRRIQRQTREYLAQEAETQVGATRARSLALLHELSGAAGPHALLGRTLWDQPAEVRLPLPYLAEAHAIITGGTGAGKTLSVMTVVEAILESEAANVSFGVLDAKGELFERTLYLVARRLAQLPPARANALREKIVIIDLSSPDPVTSYNIACPWSGSDLDYFATSRVETLQELLPSGDGLSLRGSSIIKHALMLLAEHRLPFSYFDRVVSSEVFRAKLLARSQDVGLRYYFKSHFPGEGRATIGAVRARLNSALLSSLSLKLALSGTAAPDLRALQDEGKIVLINCAGPNIPRATARTLQALFPRISARRSSRARGGRRTCGYAMRRRTFSAPSTSARTWRTCLRCRAVSDRFSCTSPRTSRQRYRTGTCSKPCIPTSAGACRSAAPHKMPHF
jgi:DNA helicase HerA-like ATPase